MSRDERRTLIDTSQSLLTYAYGNQLPVDYKTLKLIQLQLATATIIIERDMLHQKLKTQRG